MERSKVSVAQMAFILRKADDGGSVWGVCRKAVASETTFHVWRWVSTQT